MGAAINLATLPYTESDPNSRITISTVTCTGAGLTRDESAKVYYDWGVDYFGDFVHDFDLTETTLANGSKLILWGLSNTADSKDQWAAGIYLQIDASGTSNHTFTLGEIGGSTQASGTVAKANFYCRVERNGTTLTFKRATSAANRTAGTWAETVTLTVATTAYRYHYVMSTINEANATAISVATANWKGTKMTSAGTPFDTAYMAGATSGNWNAGATWGNTGSVKGTDYPGNTSDAFNIDVGDTVTYNVSETNTLANSDVYGTLNFKHDMSTILRLGNSWLYVRPGGTLTIGTAANPIGSSYTAELSLTGGSDNGYGIWFYDTGMFEVEGTDLTVGTLHTYLTQNWTSGQTFTVYGDLTAKWTGNPKILVHKHPATRSSTTSFSEFTIASMALNGSNTDITISEAAPGVTYRAGGLVSHCTRNVVVGKTSGITTPGTINSNKPSIRSYSTSLTTCYFKTKHMRFLGCYGSGNYTLTGGVVQKTGCVITNGYMAASEYGWSYNSTYDKLLVHSFQYGWYRVTGSKVTNSLFYGSGTSLAYIYGVAFDNCYFINFSYAGSGSMLYQYCRDVEIRNSDFVDHYTAYIGGTAAQLEHFEIRYYNCNFGKYRHHSNTVTTGNDLLWFGLAERFYFYNCWFLNDPITTDWVTASGGNTSEAVFDDFNNTIGDNRRQTWYYSTKSNATVVRSGGSAKSVEILDLNRAATAGLMALCRPIFEWVEWDVPASEQTRSIYIRGGTGGAEDWSTFPTAAQLYLEAEYYDEAGSTHRAFIASTAVLTDNTTWTQFPVTFTPGRVGHVVYRLRLGVGAASVKLYVDPQLNAA